MLVTVALLVTVVLRLVRPRRLRMVVRWVVSAVPLTRRVVLPMGLMSAVLVVTVWWRWWW